jgi:hypothetical protein
MVQFVVLKVTGLPSSMPRSVTSKVSPQFFAPCQETMESALASLRANAALSPMGDSPTGWNWTMPSVSCSTGAAASGSSASWNDCRSVLVAALAGFNAKTPMNAAARMHPISVRVFWRLFLFARV